MGEYCGHEVSITGGHQGTSADRGTSALSTANDRSADSAAAIEVEATSVRALARNRAIWKKSVAKLNMIEYEIQMSIYTIYVYIYVT